MSSLFQPRILEHPDLPHSTYVVLDGRIDESNLDLLKDLVDPIVQSGNIHGLIFDCNELQSMNSRVIGYFISLYTLLSEKTKIFFFRPNADISRLSEIVGLASIIQHAETIGDILAALEQE